MTNPSFDEILNQPAFDALGPEQKTMFAELAVKLQGKNNMEAFAILANFSKNAPKGKQLSKAEQSAMLEAFSISLPEKDRVKFQSLLKMMNF